MPQNSSNGVFVVQTWALGSESGLWTWWVGSGPNVCGLMRSFRVLWESRIGVSITVKFSVDRDAANDPPYFKRMYVCFDALKRGWLEGCRPIIGLYGCFLKSFCCVAKLTQCDPCLPL